MKKILVLAMPILMALLVSADATLLASELTTQELKARIEKGPAQADLIAYAYQSSPMIQSAQAMWKATAEKYKVATGLPYPRVIGEGMYMAEEIKGSPEDWKLTLTQMIPLPGRLGTEGDVVTAEARAARFNLDKAIRDVTTQIRESYQELVYIREAKRIAELNKELLDQLRTIGENAYAQNRAILYDVMKAQAQTGQLQYDTMLLEELERTEKTRMNGFLNRAPDASIGPLEDEPLRPLAYRIDEIYLMAEKNREEIKAAMALADRARAMVSVSWYENLPEVELGASLERRDSQDRVSFMAGLTLPIWPGKRSGMVGQAKAELESARSMQVAQVNEAKTMVRDNYFRLQNSERLVKLYRDDLLVQAAKAMETAETWYRQNQGSFSDYVETQAVWYNFQLALARAKSDYGKFLARLEALAGQSLTESAAKPTAASGEVSK